MSPTEPGTLPSDDAGAPARGGDLAARMGIEILEAGPDGVRARMPVAGNTQPYGLLHGGASAVLAETVGSVAAALHAGEGRAAVGTEINATHHRSARSGWVTGVATPLHLGRRTASYDIVITDDAGRRVCTARLSCMLLDAPPGAYDSAAGRAQPARGAQRARTAPCEGATSSRPGR